MKNLKYISVLVTPIAFLMACQSSNKGWYPKMQESSKVLSELMPKVVLANWEDETREQANVKALTLKLSGLAHGIDGEMAVPSLDPSLKFISRELKKELGRAELSMDQGKWKQAQAQMRRATRYCISCHSMTSSSSSSYSLKLEPRLKGLSEFEKATYFAAVRQFEKALVSYELALNDKKWAAENPELWNEGILSIMSIAGRIKRDPGLILEMASRFFDTNAYPVELKKAAYQWRVDAKEWRNSKAARINLDITYKYLRTAQNLEKRVKHSGLVQFLRASSNLNELMRMGAVAKYNEQRALFIAGQLAGALGTGFQEDYYKRCLALSKKTATSKQCKAALDDVYEKRKI